MGAGTEAHHKAIGSMDAKLVTSQADYEGTIAALGRMIASVPESKTMAVYNEFGKLVDPAVPKYLMSSVNEADAKAAYSALMEFKDVVKAHPITAKTGAAPANPKLDAAAGKLADFLQLRERDRLEQQPGRPEVGLQRLACGNHEG